MVLLESRVHDFLGIPERVTDIPTAWLAVEGDNPKTTRSVRLDVNNFSQFKAKGSDCLRCNFPRDAKRIPELAAISANRDYEVVKYYKEPNATLIAQVDDPKNTRLIHPSGVDFALDGDALFVEESFAGERRSSLVYWRKENTPKGMPSKWLKRVERIDGNDQYRVISADMGDVRIETSQNLRGKELRFVSTPIALAFWVVTSYKLLPKTSLYFVHDDGNHSTSVKRLSGLLNGQFYGRFQDFPNGFPSDIINPPKADLFSSVLRSVVQLNWFNPRIEKI